MISLSLQSQALWIYLSNDCVVTGHSDTVAISLTPFFAFDTDRLSLHRLGFFRSSPTLCDYRWWASYVPSFSYQYLPRPTLPSCHFSILQWRWLSGFSGNGCHRLWIEGWSTSLSHEARWYIEYYAGWVAPVVLWHFWAHWMRILHWYPWSTGMEACTSKGFLWYSQGISLLVEHSRLVQMLALEAPRTVW